MLNTFICLLAIFIAPIIWIELGRSLIDLCGLKISRHPISPNISRAVQLVLGLEIFLLSVFLLKLVAMPWVVAVLVPIIPALGRPQRLLRTFRSMQPKPNLNFLVWIALSLWIGLSLFHVGTDGIFTPWKNNYGDLPFHLGIISSFVFGDNFPPQYQIYAGATLSYPFLVNLWTSAFWWIDPDFRTIPLIFLSQWMVVWTVTYFLLNGNRFWLAPWAALFGGGSFWYLGQNSGELIGKGVAWTSFLSTIWVTQRGAMLGMICLLAAASLVRDRLNPSRGKRTGLETDEVALIAGLILGFSPLIHTHFFLVGLIFVGGSVLLAGLKRYYASREPHDFVTPLILLMLGLIPALLTSPWLIGKKGIISLIQGWSTGPIHTLGDSLDLWIFHAPTFIFALLIAAVFVVRRTEGLILVAIFILGNIFQLAIWEWDQIKIFLAIYLLILLIFSDYRGWRQVAAQVCCILLILPGVWEAWKIFVAGSNDRIYSAADLNLAEKIRDRLPVDSVLANAPDHNHPVTLTGRRMYMGYDGTLFSHGIDYAARREKMSDPDLLVTCSGDPSCPRFIVWTERERNYWKSPSPPRGWQKLDGLPVYKIPQPDF